MRRDTNGPALVGRQQETDLLAAALEQAASGGGGSAVLLRGEAGIGKSALLEWTGQRARERGFAVLRAVGVEAETEFAFGALHQAAWPLLQRSRALAPHQRDALESAFGGHAGTPPSGFAVGAAALALLDEAARGGPLLLVLDDLHWIDSSSATVFAFLRRRCAELPLVIVGASRPDGAAAEAWPPEPVEVRALSRPDAAALLLRRHPELASTAADRLLDEAAGNPLALVELPRQLRGEQQRGVAPLPDRLPLGRRLERMFAERLASLTPAAGRVLLLAALATGTAGGSAAWSCGTAGGDAEAALERIEADGLARLDPAGRLVFRHPLVRTAVISTASEAARREAHRVLAGLLAPDDPRRLVHEASAALLPDEALAGRLQDAGRRLARRGGDAEGALLLDRAAALSADPDERARRLTWAAVMAARGGQLHHTAALVAELKRAPVPPDIAPLFAYAVVYVDQSHRIDFESSSTLLPAALDALTTPGAESFGGLAEQVYFKLLLAATYTDDPRAWEALARHRENVSEPGRLCHRAWTEPSRGVAEELCTVVDGMNAEQEAGAAWLLLWTASAVDSADGDLWRRFTGLHGYATQGSVAKAKSYQDFLRGRWDLGPVCLREADSAEELGYHCNALMFRHYYAHFLAGRGDEAGLREIEQLIRPTAMRAGLRFVLDRLTHLRGLAALAHGRREQAYAHFAEITPPGRRPGGLPWFHVLLFDLVDAAVHTGRHREARAHVAAARAERSAELSGHHAFVLAAAAALASDDDSADTAYRAAYAVPGAEQWIFELARLRLAHGSWLRRRGRAEARDVLRAAHHVFRRLQADPWAQRCEEELRAAGDLVAPAPGTSVAGLTGQELRIARLAATGMSNKEIGNALRLSPRTVAAHLYKIFPKLGITSRAALAHALATR
ncbi:LuxR family transcriptional regulator [Kitasatospora sp. MAP5-34]|uniref:BREX system ATP-binding domain-containing protein n=1 Tax=Kitasatospora sp. MAP5-34 TaxID=3035102 RepID=UPI00247675A2|nr:LuxR family transcriptional regulator [Kitasatospora sp. MAP5-34]MDH6578215.1 DNA-binding CsgD family transcriptional regulator [Kitasatospora sp. MAP5-34]